MLVMKHNRGTAVILIVGAAFSKLLYYVTLSYCRKFYTTYIFQIELGS